MLEWMADPTAWLGLATLIVLEVVLGIDNLVFIAILAEKLPPAQRDRARLIGLTLALVMRLGLLASIAWVVTLTAPLFSVFGMEISGRDLILILGGGFLLFKATMELHERVEGGAHDRGPGAKHAVFWHVIAQIVALDIVFSLDSVITAVGMVQELSIMMIAVVVAMAVMMLASRPLMAFIGRHPTVVVLCLGLLLMIGFSLVAEGLDFHVPKGYLYAAIGFSILVETFNQLAARNRAGRGPTPAAPGAIDAGSIMVPRADIPWIGTGAAMQDAVDRFAAGHAAVPLCDGQGARVVGVLHAQDLLSACRASRDVDLRSIARPPRRIGPTTPVGELPAMLRQTRDGVLIVVDADGAWLGVVTAREVLAGAGAEPAMA